MAVRGTVSDAQAVPLGWVHALAMVAAVVSLGGGIIGENLVFAVVGAVAAAVAAVMKLAAVRGHSDA